MTTTAVVTKNTIMDVVNSYTSLDGSAKFIAAANVLARACPFFLDMPMRASNQIFSNIGARVTYLPTPGTRRFNEGVAPTASHSTPFTEAIAMLEDYSEVDKTLYDIQNNPDQWRLEKDMGKMEAMSQKAEALIIDGKMSTDPGAFDGLSTRFYVSTHRPNGDSTWPYNVKLAGGSSAVSSIWVVKWGDKVYGIYPKNLPAGIKIDNLGETTAVTNSLAAPYYYQVLRTHMALYFGLNIEDERYVQRLANIETSGSSNIFDPAELVEVINNIPGGGGGATIYAPRSIKTQMDIAAMDKNNAWYTVDASGDVFGREVLRFRGLPVRLAETMSTETAIS